MPEGGARTSLVNQALAVAASQGRVPVTFGPGEPLAPAAPQQPPRAFDFPVGWNTNYIPRAQEAFTFSHLRAFANVELARLAIETRKDQIERLDWRVKPREGRNKGVDKGRVRKAEALFSRPDGATPFASWLRLLLEDLLVLDAPTFEKQRTRGGDLFALEVVDGSTVKPLLDEQGRRPRAPAAAYQQVIKGLPWANLSTADLVYAPRNLRPGHAYGFGPVEQLIVTINIALRRQTAQLAWFTEGNMPPGMINAPEGWTPEQIKQYSEWVAARLTGNAGERAKILWGPHGAQWKPFKEPPLKDEFDEWLARMVCFAFSLPVTAFIKQLNRSTSETSDTTALEEGREPLMRWWKRIADDLIQNDMGFPELEFEWVLAEDIDPVKKAERDERYVKSGILTIDRVRDSLGEEPLPKGAGSRAFIVAGAAVIPVDRVGASDGEDGEEKKPADKGGDA